MTGAGIPAEWSDVETKAARVDKVDPGAIQDVARQFDDASRDAGDHTAALTNAAAPLRDGGVWDGPAADRFFDYVGRVAAAGNKVKDKLDEVAAELSTLQGTLADLKQEIRSTKEDARKTIDERNDDAQGRADAATARMAAYRNGEADAPPAPTAEEIIAAAGEANRQTARDAAKRIDALLRQSNEAIKRAQQLMKAEIGGGFSTVPPPGSADSQLASTGGITHETGGGGSSGGSGASGGGGAPGGGGGLGPSGGPPSSGPPPGNVDQWIREAIKILQANGIPVTEDNIDEIWTIIEKESGGDPHAINNWDCVPLDTMILTRRGWLKHDQVRIGDETIGYNTATRRSEWTRITRVVHHDDAPLVRIGNSRWQAITTPNHNWVNVPRVSLRQTGLPTICPECEWMPRNPTQAVNGVAVHRRKRHGIIAPKQRHVYVTDARFVHTGQIRSRDRVLLAAPAETDSRLDISVREAGILGWVAGDGHVETRRHRPTISIAQSKPEMVRRLRELLDGIPHAVYADDRGGCGPRHQFRLDHDYARGLLARAGHPKSEAVAQVIGMSSEQRAAWLNAVIDAEGHRSMRPGCTRPKVTIYQRPGAVLDAIVLAVYLSGARPRVLRSTREGRPESWSEEMSVRSNKAVVTGGFLAKEDTGRGDVWCVTTGLGTWTAMAGEHVFLTGNSNAAKGTPSKGLMQCIDPTFEAHKLPGHDDIYNPVDNIIAGVRYTFDRYGGFEGHPGLASMAGGGGYQGY